MRSLLLSVLSGAWLLACASDPGAPVAPAPDAAAADGATVPDVAVLDTTTFPDATAPDLPVAPDAPVDTAGDVTTSRDVPASEAALDVASPVDASVSEDAVDVPTFGAIYRDILRPRCSSCHDRDGGWGGQFRMPDAATAYRELVNVRTTTTWIETCVALMNPRIVDPLRVRPGAPEVSLLYYLPQCYVRDADHMRLTQEERATIRAWIAAGALPSGF